MRSFLDQVGAVVPADDDVLLLGDGEVVAQFANHIQVRDRNRSAARRIEVEKSGPMTEPQLLARIRDFAGAPAKRGLSS
jgi:hypothetical protein